VIAGQIPIVFNQGQFSIVPKKVFWGGLKRLVLRGWSAGTGLAAVFMIHKFKVSLKSCITS
jgi:hypothetical protein